MGADARYTHNPALHFDVVSGQFDVQFFANRTLSFTLEDHARRYDEIRWVLDNRDGAFTAIQNIALGLIVRVRLGYADDTQSWRSFVISRMTGGVGVLDKDGLEMAAVGSGESTIEYSGRNRNAPDLKGRRKKKKGSAKGKRDPYVSSVGVTGRGGIVRKRPNPGGSTKDIAKLDSVQRDAWYGPLEGNQRIFYVRHLSEAMYEIAYRNGYTDKQIAIEDTDDSLTQVVIPIGISDAQFVERKADELNWKWKFEPTEFRFHSERWKKTAPKIKDIFTYGGPDITNLQIDFDFKLPMPKSITTKSYNPMKRGMIIGKVDENNSTIQNRVALLYAFDDANILSPDKAQRRTYLERESIYNIPGGTKKVAGLKAQNEFVRRHLRAMRLTVRIVGNPDINGGDTIILKGTGCPLVDGVWHVQVARHIFNGTTYETELELNPASKNKTSGEILLRGEIHSPTATSKGLSGYGHVFLRARQTDLKQLAKMGYHIGAKLPDGSAKVGGK